MLLQRTHQASFLPGFQIAPQPERPDTVLWLCRRGAIEKKLVKFSKPPKKKDVLRWQTLLFSSPALKALPGRGRAASAAYRVLVDMINWKTGHLEASYETIAKMACFCRTTIYWALKFLRDHNIIAVVPRFVRRPLGDGRVMQQQVSNAYALLPPSRWKISMDSTNVFSEYPEKWPEPMEICRAARSVGQVREGYVLLARYGNEFERKMAALDLALLDRKKKPPD